MSGKYTIALRNFIIMSIALLLSACGDANDVRILELNGSAMGTGYKITALDRKGDVDKDALHTAIEEGLGDINQYLSNWNPNSEVSRFNAMQSTDPVKVSPYLADVVRASQEIHRASNGLFDITLGPVIEVWGFGSKNQDRNAAPDPAALQAAMEASGQTGKLVLDGVMLSKARADTELFLSAIGKGYGVDYLAGIIRRFGITDFMVDIGGDTFVSGKNANGGKWQMAIEVPNAMTRQIHKVASVSNLGMATSGDYRNYYERDGKRYSHIIDPGTGHPVTHKTASVTVLANNTMMADGWATALLAAGSERGMKIATDHNLAVMFIDRVSGNLDDGFNTITSKRFTALQDEQ